MTREEIQADAETQVVPREVADRLAEELQNIANLDDDAADMAPLMASLALAEYRKAVPHAR